MMDEKDYILEDYHLDGAFFVVKYKGHKEFDIFVNEILEFIHVHDSKLHEYLFPMLNKGRYEDALQDLISLEYDFYDLIHHYVISTGTYSIFRREDSDQFGLF